MANVTVWLFDSPGGAAGALTQLQTLAIEGVLDLVDSAMVEWSDERPDPVTTPFKQPGLSQLMGSGRLLGGLRRRSVEVEGLDHEFVERFHSRVTPGT